MALVTTTIVMKSVWTPYERPPDQVALWSAIPRGLQSFVVDTGALDAKPINDDQLLNCTATLPANFGYVMADGGLNVAQDRAVDWQSNSALNLQNFFQAPTDLSVGLNFTWQQGFKAVLDNTLIVSDVRASWPAFPMVAPRGTSGILVVFSAFNGNDTAAAAGTVNAFVSFWQFDLEQLRKYPINSPVPTHSR